MDKIIHEIQVMFDGRKIVACPGTVYVKKTEFIRFNFFDSAGLLFLPRENFFIPEETDYVRVTTVKNGDKLTFGINPAVEAGEKSPYAFYDYSRNDFAEGNSSPRIIIEKD